VDQLLIALDVETGPDALALADTLKDVAGGFKIGSRLFTAKDRRSSACRTWDARLPRSEVSRHSQHGRRRGAISRGDRCVDGERARSAARDDDARCAETAAREGRNPPLVVAVTVLTSMAAAAPESTGADAGADQWPVAGLAQAAPDGASPPQETAFLRQRFGTGFTIVTLWIRGGGAAAVGKDDQARMMSPAGALAPARATSSGRPIIAAADLARDKSA
jgi:orotidine-5'-phosphate decarboxylase